ncbi:hypothetical protein [Agaribacter flavus]|uniref:Lipoprotein n=1 Tax=Agaribacter flavus TaxID=1902781 RepID=A0ABV7FKE5_9ALTE
MNKNQGRLMLAIAAIVAFLTALAHMSCIAIGPQCYSVQMAPEAVVHSAESGTLLAPIATVFVALVFSTIGCYALSAAKVIRNLPLLRFGIYAIAFICVVRGVLPFQLWIRHPEKVALPVLVVGFVWLLVGVCYFFGYRAVNKYGQS